MIRKQRVIYTCAIRDMYVTVHDKVPCHEGIELDESVLDVRSTDPSPYVPCNFAVIIFSQSEPVIKDSAVIPIIIIMHLIYWQHQSRASNQENQYLYKIDTYNNVKLDSSDDKSMRLTNIRESFDVILSKK